MRSSIHFTLFFFFFCKCLCWNLFKWEMLSGWRNIFWYTCCQGLPGNQKSH